MMLDSFHPLDIARLWCAIGTLDLLRNVGRIEELLRMGWQGHRDLASEPGTRRILGRVRIWVLLPRSSSWSWRWRSCSGHWCWATTCAPAIRSTGTAKPDPSRPSSLGAGN